MLNLAFQWTANLSVEKGFGVAAQSLLPAEGAFARKADYPIPQPVQRESQKSLAGSQSCRPSNSPVGTMTLLSSVMMFLSCRPSNSPVGTITNDDMPVSFLSCRPSNSPVGTIGPLLTSRPVMSCRPSNSPVGTIIEFHNTNVNSLAGLPIPQLVQSSQSIRGDATSLAGLPIPQLVQSRPATRLS